MREGAGRGCRDPLQGIRVKGTQHRGLYRGYHRPNHLFPTTYQQVTAGETPFSMVKREVQERGNSGPQLPGVKVRSEKAVLPQELEPRYCCYLLSLEARTFGTAGTTKLPATVYS